MAGCGRMTHPLRENDAVGLRVDNVEFKLFPSCLLPGEVRWNTAVAPEGGDFRQVEEGYERRMR